MQLDDLRLPSLYQTMSFDTWDMLPNHALIGKELARAAGELFATALENKCEVLLSSVYKKCNLPFDISDKKSNWIAFYGDLGRGKSGLLASICNKINVQKRSSAYCINCRYMNWRQLIDFETDGETI